MGVKGCKVLLNLWGFTWVYLFFSEKRMADKTWLRLNPPGLWYRIKIWRAWVALTLSFFFARSAPWVLWMLGAFGMLRMFWDRSFACLGALGGCGGGCRSLEHLELVVLSVGWPSPTSSADWPPMQFWAEERLGFLPFLNILLAVLLAALPGTLHATPVLGVCFDWVNIPCVLVWGLWRQPRWSKRDAWRVK